MDPDLTTALSPALDAGAIVGAVALVGDHRSDREPAVTALGTLAVDDPTPMPTDAVFRIASVTKPIVAVAALRLVDRGLLALDQPVDDLLPELADRRVLRRTDGPLDETDPSPRAITVEDLLTFRLGLGVVFNGGEPWPIQQAEDERELRTFARPWPPPPHDADGWIAALGELPLLDAPGVAWRYNTGAQVLGVLLARASGSTLGEVLRQEVLDPLGMVDTGFSFRPDQAGRATSLHAADPETGQLEVVDRPDGWWGAPPRFEDGSAGLVSTAADLWRFASFVADGGRVDGTELLTPATFARFTTDALTDEQHAQAEPITGPHTSWGLGVGVPRRPGSAEGAGPDPVGVGWDGGSGVSWRTDVTRGRTGILLTTTEMTSPEPPEAFGRFWTEAHRRWAARSA